MNSFCTEFLNKNEPNLSVQDWSKACGCSETSCRIPLCLLSTQNKERAAQLFEQRNTFSFQTLMSASSSQYLRGSSESTKNQNLNHPASCFYKLSSFEEVPVFLGDTAKPFFPDIDIDFSDQDLSVLDSSRFSSFSDFSVKRSLQDDSPRIEVIALVLGFVTFFILFLVCCLYVRDNYKLPLKFRKSKEVLTTGIEQSLHSRMFGQRLRQTPSAQSDRAMSGSGTVRTVETNEELSMEFSKGPKRKRRRPKLTHKKPSSSDLSSARQGFSLGNPRAKLRYQYHRYSTMTRESNLSSLLRNRFSVKTGTTASFKRASIQSLAISVASVQSFKTQVTEEEMSQYKKIKAHYSLKLSESASMIEEFVDKLSNYSEEADDANKYTGRKDPSQKMKNLKERQERRVAVKNEEMIQMRRIINRICDKLEPSILSAAEVQKIEASSMVVELGGNNDLSLFEDNTPKIGLEMYLFGLATAMNRWFHEDGRGRKVPVGIRCLVLSLIYLERIKEEVMNFTLTIHNVHRLFCIMMLLAAKFTEDNWVSNKYWATISGISLQELNELEDKFCFQSGFKFFVEKKHLLCLYQIYDINRVGEGDESISL